jgi:hypothetical protein
MTNQTNPQNEESICPICLDNDLKEEYVLTKCKHKFCPLCYVKHMRLKNNCPMCRNELAPPPPQEQYKDFQPTNAIQLIHLDILSRPEYIQDLEKAVGLDKPEKTETERIDDILQVLTKFGISIAGRCKRYICDNGAIDTNDITNQRASNLLNQLTHFSN